MAATDKIKTKKLNDLQQHALNTMLTGGEMDFYQLYRSGIKTGTASWLTKQGLTEEVSVRVEGSPPKRAWKITDTGREAQRTGCIAVPPKAAPAPAEADWNELISARPGASASLKL